MREELKAKERPVNCGKACLRNVAKLLKAGSVIALTLGSSPSSS